MPVERMEVEEILEGKKKIPPPLQVSSTSIPEPIPIPKKNPTRAEIEAEYSAITAAFKVAARVLAVRLFLFLSLIGSFVLAIIATDNGSPQSSWVLLLYAIVTTLPLTVLEIWGKRRGG